MLSESDFEAALVNFCCYGYGANASEVVQKQRLAQGHCWSFTNSLNSQFYSCIYGKTYLAVYYLLIGDTSGVSAFSRQIKMSNLLHVGLNLIISKVFTILCLLCQCRYQEYRGKFQSKTAISKQLFFQMSAQIK